MKRKNKIRDLVSQMAKESPRPDMAKLIEKIGGEHVRKTGK